MLHYFAERRLRKIDRARVNLFDLDDGERPIEAASIWVFAGWPSMVGGMPVDPDFAAKTNAIGGGLVDLSLISVPSVLLLTYTHLRWCPHRTYRGRMLFNPQIDRIFSNEVPPGPDTIYGKFSHPILGPRSVRIGDIAHASLEEFIPGDAGLIKIRLLENRHIPSGDYLWPEYDISRAAQLGALFGPIEDQVWSEGGRSMMQLRSSDAATLTFAMSMSRAFDYVELPFRTEDLSGWDQEQWENYSRTEQAGLAAAV